MNQSFATMFSRVLVVILIFQLGYAQFDYDDLLVQPPTQETLTTISPPTQETLTTISPPTPTQETIAISTTTTAQVKTVKTDEEDFHTTEQKCETKLTVKPSLFSLFNEIIGTAFQKMKGDVEQNFDRLEQKIDEVREQLSQRKNQQPIENVFKSSTEKPVAATTESTEYNDDSKLEKMVDEDVFEDDFFSKEMPSTETATEIEKKTSWLFPTIVAIPIAIGVSITTSIILIWCCVRNVWCCIKRQNKSDNENKMEQG